MLSRPPKNQRSSPRAVGEAGEGVARDIGEWCSWWWGERTSATIHCRRIFVNKMSPRKYDMGKRAAAAAETRRRIVEATHQLHKQQGIAATSWEDIAERAGVGVGTVYRHFPTPDDLLPLCGAVAMEV